MERVLTLLNAVPGNPLRGFVIGYLWFVLGCLAAVAIILASGIDVVWALVAGAFAATAVVVLPILAFFSRPIAKDIARIRERHLAHWTYADDDWGRFEQDAWRRTRREAALFPLFAIVLALVTGVIAWLAASDVLAGLLAAGAFLGIGLVAAATTLISGRIRLARRRRVTGDVYISDTGVLQPSGYMPFRGFNQRLTEVAVEEGQPPSLRFVTESWSDSGLPRTSEFRIPVPPGHEDDARSLAATLLAGPPKDQPGVTTVDRRFAGG
jgi:hypothetical protein